MPGEVYTRRIFGSETEYGITTVGAGGKRILSPDEAARYLFRPVQQRHHSTNIFLTNASRLYLDVGAHPEYATAECDGLSQLIAQERAGDALVHELAQRAEQAMATDGIAGTLYLLRNNVDSVGNSYGCHENYLVGRSAVLKRLGRQLVPFLITRQLICGAGLVTRPAGERPAGFVLSQRSDQVWEGVSSATTRSRPIINTRDEPHADSHRYRRMHVIVGDSNVAEPSTALKVGTTLIVLEMLEAGVPLANLELRDPIALIRQVARDLTGGTPLELAERGTITALELQRVLCEAAGEYLATRDEPAGGGTPTAELTRVWRLWGRVLDAIETGELAAVATEVDWIAKYLLLQRCRERLGAGWEHPKLGQLDLAYHDIHPDRGLRSVLERKGRLARWVSEADVAAARRTPPATTRAVLRGRFLQRAEEIGAPVTVDWMRLKANRPEPKIVELPDPFATASGDVDGLLDYLDANAEFYAQGRDGRL